MLLSLILCPGKDPLYHPGKIHTVGSSGHSVSRRLTRRRGNLGVVAIEHGLVDFSKWFKLLALIVFGVATSAKFNLSKFPVFFQL